MGDPSTGSTPYPPPPHPHTPHPVQYPHGSPFDYDRQPPPIPPNPYAHQSSYSNHPPPPPGAAPPYLHSPTPAATTTTTTMRHAASSRESEIISMYTSSPSTASSFQSHASTYSSPASTVPPSNDSTDLDHPKPYPLRYTNGSIPGQEYEHRMYQDEPTAPRPFVSSSGVAFTRSASSSARRPLGPPAAAAHQDPYAPRPPPPTTFVSPSGAAFTRNPSLTYAQGGPSNSAAAATAPAYLSYVVPPPPRTSSATSTTPTNPSTTTTDEPGSTMSRNRSNSNSNYRPPDKRPLNPPPIPDYYRSEAPLQVVPAPSNGPLLPENPRPRPHLGTTSDAGNVFGTGGIVQNGSGAGEGGFERGAAGRSSVDSSARYSLYSLGSDGSTSVALPASGPEYETRSSSAGYPARNASLEQYERGGPSRGSWDYERGGYGGSREPVRNETPTGGPARDGLEEVALRKTTTADPSAGPRSPYARHRTASQPEDDPFDPPPVGSVDPAPPPQHRTRQPTILMSPPLEAPQSPSRYPSSPYDSYYPSNASSARGGPGTMTTDEVASPRSYSSATSFGRDPVSTSVPPAVVPYPSRSAGPRNGSYDSGRPGSYGRSGSVLTGSSSTASSPNPSPSLSSYAPSFDGGGAGGATSHPLPTPRRPSHQATLSPLASSSSTSFSTAVFPSRRTSSSSSSAAFLQTHHASSYPYPTHDLFSSSDSYSLLSPSPSTQDLFPSPSSLSPSPSFNGANPNSSGDPATATTMTTTRYLNPAFLSHLAVYVKDHVPRGKRVTKSSIEHERCFTGKDVVDTIVRVLPVPTFDENRDDRTTTTTAVGQGPPLPANPRPSSLHAASSAATGLTSTSTSPPDRHTVELRALALSIARTLHQSLYFHEVDFSIKTVQDSSDQVFTFLSDERGLEDDDDDDDLEYDDEGQRLDSVTSATEFLVLGSGGTAWGPTGDPRRRAISHKARPTVRGPPKGDDEIPTGVLTELTRCLSPFCDEFTNSFPADRDGDESEGVRGRCYSYTCPNRPKSLQSASSGSLSAQSGLVEAPLEEAENWASSVPRSILESLDKREVAYQNQVFELIQGEQKYLDDLNLIESGFIEPLRSANPPIIAPHRLPHFLSSILLNILEIRAHSAQFLAALRAKQAESIVVRGGIGKLVLSSAVEWGQAYIKYTVGFPMADWLFKEEKAINPRFNDLLMDFHKRPEASKRGFDTFHNRATFRGLRYILLLEQILKNAPEDTEQDRQDREYLQEAIKVIRQQGKEADAGIAETKARVSLREFERALVRKQGDLHDLELLDESRRFFLAGKVYRRPEGSGFTDQFQEAHLVLFDNYLVTTKAPRLDRDGKQRYLISRRPVPLDLVQLRASSFTDPPVPRSSGFHLRSNRSAGSPQPSTAAATSGPADSSLLYPISFFQMGRFDGLVHLYVDSPAQRLEWERKLKEAVALRAQRQEANRVVRLDPLADTTFGTTSTIGSLNAGPTGGTNQFGRPTCSTPLQTIDGLWLVIAGCQEGIFIGWRGRPHLQQVVHLPGVTSVAVLPDFSFLLVVANKVLVAYALEALIPTKTSSKLDQANKAPQRLSGQKDVSFFRVGKVGDSQDARTLVIYAKKSGVKESVFKALEPVSQNDRAKGGSGGHRFLGFGTGRPEWFRVHKEFFMPSLVTSIQFQKSKLALIGSRGVEIMDLESMRTMTVPDFPSVRHNRHFAALAKRCEEVPTMGMFRIADSKFLLVYADFAFHVGRHGEPIEGPLIEWESKPEQVAFCFPYVFAVSPTIIEIRNAFTGRLAQFITGSHIFLTFDGSAIPSSQHPPTSSSSSLASLDARSPRGSSLSSASNSITGHAIEHETPVEKRLHVSIRTGSYHVLYEIVIVA
ncbi:hypothetical protein JCM10212_005550 [Sporobolomyces blumeae]